ncbi:uncharacterized protein LOC113143926 [Mastacembelus armatus]|uniref:uncharacterized protein LOC113143926 n=1 Tax=Mastacembelus armatus TaxID=205130 RepID=UPI000E45F449|nr:uncharacterized protein LOC113143926 [Mastacembelus armatus]
MTKKLAGSAAGTAAWVTNVGNEHGQVLMSVLTAAEGDGLLPMAAGLMQRYREAQEPPPRVLYVDRECCSLTGQTKVVAMFHEWDRLVVRLDVRRFARGVTTESHHFYGQFMARLSYSIFEWDKDDIARREKANMSKEGERITKLSSREVARHCHRRTRGVPETERLIQELLDAFWDVKDDLGVPLIDHAQMEEIWSTQRRHLHCIQDPQGVELYTKTGEIRRGGIRLPVYRCARGSTSLESFHLHLCRFIPGNSASALHFQVYLLEGLARWNENRARAAVEGAPRTRTHCYNATAQLRPAHPGVRGSHHGRKLHQAHREYTGKDVIGPDGLGGYQHVTALAHTLVELLHQAFVPQHQAWQIVELWLKLTDRDKAAVSFPPCHQDRLVKGRFKTSRSAHTPGVDSVQRAFLGKGAGAAQTPKASRLVEAMFVELCQVHYEGRTIAGVRVNRWGVIMREYNTIRDIVVSCQTLMANTSINLFLVNQRTLMQW